MVQNSVQVDNAGNLKGAILNTFGDTDNIHTLTITGFLDARDFQFMRDSLSKLSELDIEAVTINEYIGSEGTDPQISFYPANELPAFSFYNSSTGDSKVLLKDLKLPSSITSIGYKALAGCTGFNDSIFIPSLVSSFSREAFDGCSKLESFSVSPQNLYFTDVDGIIYSKNKKTLILCPLNKAANPLILPSELEEIADYAFFNCTGIKGDLIFPNYLKTIGKWAFAYCSGLKKVVFPDSLMDIGESAFTDCSGLKDGLVIPALITEIKDFTFFGCSGFKDSLVLPNSIKHIGNGAFYNCQGFSGKLDLPDSLISIGAEAFYNCKSFTGSLYITDNVISIGARAFKNAKGLTIIKLHKTTPPSIASETFDLNCQIRVPLAAIAIYKATDYWKNYPKIMGLAIVTFVNSMSVSGDSTIETDDNVTLQEPLINSAPGHQFLGWYKDSGFVNQWIFATDVVIDDLYLYARWTKNTYVVNFNSNGGSLVQPQNIPYQSLVNVPSMPQMEHYLFSGWFVDQELSKSWDFSSNMVTQDTTLFAKWQPKPYIVSFETYGGNVINDTAITYNHLVNQPANPVKTGYQFDKWYKDSLYITTWNFDTALVTANTVLYAKWVALSYNIHFETNGGSPINDTVILYNDHINRPANPTKNELLFDGWFKKSDFSVIWDFKNDVITANTTIYAKWISPDYTVHFETTGGTTIEDTVISYNNHINRPANPQKNGYLFDDWFKDPDFTVVWNFENDVITANTIIYAKWVPVTTINSENKNEIIVYPVPTYNILHIKGTGFTAYELYDLSGKQVLIGRISESSTTNAIEMGSIQSGQYTILLNSKTGNKAMFKIIKK